MRRTYWFPLLLLIVLSLTFSAPACNDDETEDIVDIAVDDDRFETLVTALEAAGLDETLRGDGPFTVFAPTDDAFADLPAGTVEALLEDIPALTDILLYHVVSGEVMAAEVVSLDSVTTVQGQDVSIQVEDGNVYVSDALVIDTDIEASNGVIHVIDAVLTPTSSANASEVPNMIMGETATKARIDLFSKPFFMSCRLPSLVYWHVIQPLLLMIQKAL
jgi:uncharacterized surface protein with fasciclin (FAS1) repeats